MANLNRIILVGRLTEDPEVRYTVEGVPLTRFRLAVDRVLGKGGTDFINIIAWRRLAEICGQYLKKGRLALVEGRIQVRSYETQAGQRKWATEVVAQNMQMLEGARPLPETPPKEEVPLPEGSASEEPMAEDESELPF